MVALVFILLFLIYLFLATLLRLILSMDQNTHTSMDFDYISRRLINRMITLFPINQSFFSYSNHNISTFGWNNDIRIIVFLFSIKILNILNIELL